MCFNNKTGKICLLLLFLYLCFLFCEAVILRVPSKDYGLQTDWFWGYKSDIPSVFYGDNFLNIALFIPIGCLIAMIVSKFRAISSFFMGLFVSETIECSQLIWERGAFDVDDILNNTIGALVGGLLVTCFLGIRKLRRKNGQSVL